jgi:arylformamidase
MTAIDYEKEYDNRSRVPEHQQIFANWARDAEAYRAKMLDQDRAELGLQYGRSARQTIDMFFCEQRSGAPLAIFIHGGWWRSLEPASFSHMAAGLNARGVNVAVVGYDLCPQVTIAEIIDQMRRACLFVWQRFQQRVLIYGHSAGGHLAAAMLATDWIARDANIPADFVPAAFALSGIFDLSPLIGISTNQDLRLDLQEARDVSPVFWRAPRGRVLDAYVGALESSEFLRQSRLIADAWGKAGVAARYQEVAEKNHFTVLDALPDPASAMIDRLVVLAAHVHGK